MIVELRVHEILGHTLSGDAVPTAVTEEKETRQFPLPNAGVSSPAKAARRIVLPKKVSGKC